MSRFIYLSLFLFLMASCSNDDDGNLNSSCSVANPLESIDWLKSEIDSGFGGRGEYYYVVQTQFNNQTVFIFANCNPLANAVIPVKNCKGENVGIIGSREEDIPLSVLENGTVIWKSDNFSCEL